MDLSNYLNNLDEIFLLTEKTIVTDPHQPWGDLKKNTDEEVERVYADAMKYVAKAEKEYERILKRSKTEGAKILTDIKSLDSFGDKIINRGKKASLIHDVLRGSILVKTNRDVDEVVNNIEKRNAIFEIEHKEKGKDEYGYYGSVHFKIKVKGIICEIQIMTKKLFQSKEQGHTIYAKWRSADKKTSEFKKDTQQSKRIYDRGNRPSDKPSKKRYELTESRGNTNAFLWKKGKEWYIAKPQGGNKSTATFSSDEEWNFGSEISEKKNRANIDEVGDGFYKVYTGDGTFRNNQASNIVKTDLDKEIAKIEKAEGKKKGHFTDMVAGSRGNAGKVFQGMVRGAQEAAAQTRMKKLAFLLVAKTAKKAKDFDKRNEYGNRDF